MPPTPAKKVGLLLVLLVCQSLLLLLLLLLFVLYPALSCTQHTALLHCFQQLLRVREQPHAPAPTPLHLLVACVRLP
jgi:hypothetical protein